jgi:hypothetical protein
MGARRSSWICPLLRGYALSHHTDLTKTDYSPHLSGPLPLCRRVRGQTSHAHHSSLLRVYPQCCPLRVLMTSNRFLVKPNQFLSRRLSFIFLIPSFWACTACPSVTSVCLYSPFHAGIPQEGRSEGLCVFTVNQTAVACFRPRGVVTHSMLAFWMQKSFDRRDGKHNHGDV